MKIFVLAIFSFINFSLYGQKEVVQYLDHKFFPVEKESALYYRVYHLSKENKKEGLEKTYRISGDLYSKGLYENNLKHGALTKYYSNGAIYSETVFELGIETSSKVWFRNGKIMEEGQVYDRVYRVISAWDSLGNQLVNKGTGSYISYHENGSEKEKGQLDGYLKQGKWEGFYENGTLYYVEEYKNGSLKEGKSWNDEEQLFLYSTLNTPDVENFSKNAERFFSKIGKKLEYPPSARRHGIQGKVFIKFYIDGEGKMRDAEVLKGIGYGCDEEVLRVFKLVSDELQFPDVLERGQPSRASIVVPITFKLG